MLFHVLFELLSGVTRKVDWRRQAGGVWGYHRDRVGGTIHPVGSN